MTKASMKVLLVPVALLLATAFSNTARSDEKAVLAKKTKVGWNYTPPEGEGKGSFICMKPQGDGYGSPWVEVITEKNEKVKSRHEFVQVARTSDYVLLYDAKRQMTVILDDNACYVMFPGLKGVQKLYSGTWHLVTY